MDFNVLVGQAFQENEFYELLLFELEENLEQYFFKCFHFYFESASNGKIKIVELVSFKDNHEMNQISRKLIEKREWFEIHGRQCSVALMLCRQDRTGFLSLIKKDHTHTEEWKHGWADEGPPRPPMTPDEIRQAFRELAGVLEDQQGRQGSKSKKAV